MFLDIQKRLTTRDHPFDASILHWTFLIPPQDRKFHELLLALDPTLKDWEIPKMFGNPLVAGNKWALSYGNEIWEICIVGQESTYMKFPSFLHLSEPCKGHH